MANNRWLRLLFVLVLGQALLLARALFWPDRITENLPWPASPLNARFVAALYCMGVVTSLLSIVAARYAALRISVITLCGLTGGLLVLTLPHLGEFHGADFPWRWLGFYSVDVVVTGWVLWKLRGRDPAPPGRSPAAPLLYGYAGLMAVAGAVMLVAPAFAVGHWPWHLTSILSQVYSVFFLVFAFGGILAASDPRTEAIWIYLAANLAMVVIVLAVSVLYPEPFKSGTPTVAWYVLWIACGLTLVASLLVAVGSDRRRAAVAVVTP
ncbi:MAG TPA: hypothetical protein VKB69_07055 [Micromonosporaceae bacterium]|nr:hypothetical protein [Micromonosporaceae bacterium]